MASAPCLNIKINKNAESSFTSISFYWYIETDNRKSAFEHRKQVLNTPLCLLVSYYIGYRHMSLFKTAHPVTARR